MIANLHSFFIEEIFSFDLVDKPTTQKNFVKVGTEIQRIGRYSCSFIETGHQFLALNLKQMWRAVKKI